MSAANPFNPRLVFGLIAAGVVAFAALLLLLAFGGSMNSGRDGRGHALSVSAIGFKGMVDLVGAFHHTGFVRGPDDFAREDLVVAALEPESRPGDLKRLLDQRAELPTLIILPKWMTIPDPNQRGWVRELGPFAGVAAAPLLGAQARIRVAEARAERGQVEGAGILDGLSMPVPVRAQTVTGDELTPLARIRGGGALVAQIGDRPHYVVADPDLLNNHGLRDPEVARAALALIEALNPTGEGVAFDLTVNGLGADTQPSLLRTAFEPPFLVMTLALAAAAILAGLHGAVRFGAARREARAIALGKAALVENSAGLIRLAKREARLGAAYADVVRVEAARTASAPLWLSGDALDAYLDKLSRADGPSFSELAARLAQARDRHELVAAARALFSWKKDIIR